MKRILITSVAVSALGGMAQAGGIDRSGQGIGILFEPGRYAELSFGHVSPKIDGTDAAGQPTGSVVNSYSQIAFGYKYDINSRLSFALIVDQPFGADVFYPVIASAPFPDVLDGTKAKADAVAVSGILRYKLDNGFSVHGGLRAQKAEGEITLSGAAYSTLSGYNVKLASDIAPGYLVGIAYEKPEIALRVALTYNSAITHKFDTTQSAPFPSGTITEVELPQSVNLDFQSGVAKDTLVFGQIRWVDWSAFLIDPVGFPGNGLVELEDTTTYTLGVGRRFSEKWAGSISFTYEGGGSDDLVSPLAPTNGRRGVTIGAAYTEGNMKVSMGLNYTKVGDARPETGTPDVARASMTDNDLIGLGIKVGWTF
ncbi:MAG: outer membrane protein transport protein [Paracoccaceae bacterium]